MPTPIDDGAAGLELHEFPRSSLASETSESTQNSHAAAILSDAATMDPERVPLIGSSGSSSPGPSSPGPSTPTRYFQANANASAASPFIRPIVTRRHFHSSEEDSIFSFAMEKIKSSKVAHYADKLAVEY